GPETRLSKPIAIFIGVRCTFLSSFNKRKNPWAIFLTSFCVKFALCSFVSMAIPRISEPLINFSNAVFPIFLQLSHLFPLFYRFHFIHSFMIPFYKDSCKLSHWMEA